MADAKHGYFLRPEAGPVPYRALQKRQKEVLKQLVRALIAAADGTGGGPEVGEDLSIDTDRASRLFFISAEPGCGKSTLYLTLKAMLSHNTDRRWVDQYDGPDLKPLQDAVRWLEPIDLEVAGDDRENLLAAVVVRLRDTLQEQSDSAFSTPCQKAIRLLEELASDIGMAWEGNLQARARALDPDSYSMEVMRAQRARLGVSKRLRMSLDQLATNKCCGCNDSTLFLLPVDDFYLKPDASLQLLRLLRMISDPRLFFLIMGDIKTVEALFVEKVLADWTAVAGTEIFAALPHRRDEVLARAREQRARHLRKLVPPDQRATIEVMDWDEGMKFRPENSKSLTQNTLKEMWELLKKVELDPTIDKTTQDKTKNDPADNLLDFLVSPPWEKPADPNDDGKHPAETDEPRNAEARKNDRRSARKKKAREAYAALQIFDATPREIMDLWIAFYEWSQQSKATDIGAPALLMRTLRFVGLAIDEQDFLTEQQQKTLSGVLPTRHYRRDVYLNARDLLLQPDASAWEYFDGRKVGVRKHLAWNLTVPKPAGGKPFAQQKDPFDKLPPRPAAWIILLHDLAWKWSRNSLTGNLVVKLCQKLDDWSTPISELTTEGGSKTKQENDVSDDCPGWAVYKDGKNYKHFSLPNEFETFRDLDRFLWVWSCGLEAKIGLQGRRDFENLWDFAKSTVIEGKYGDFAKDEDSWFKIQFADFKKSRPNASRKSKS